MSIDTERTVAEIVFERPQAAEVFERLGIDYCCGGRKPLAVVCGEAGIDVDHVADLLERTNQSGEAENWSAQSLASLISHIVQKHHSYCREESLRLQALLAKVISKHGEHHPELTQVEELFTVLCKELSMHLMKEEQMLFPYIIALEQSETDKSVAPQAPFGTVQNPVRMMMIEHDDAGRVVNEIRSLTGNFVPPQDACNSFKVLYQSMEAFAADLHLHIHLENNLLFPSAIALEDPSQSA